MIDLGINGTQVTFVSFARIRFLSLILEEEKKTNKLPGCLQLFISW